MNKQETVAAMSDFLINKAKKCGVDIHLKGINQVNYNSVLDRVFQDDGKTRVQFIGLAKNFISKSVLSDQERVLCCIEGAVLQIRKTLQGRKTFTTNGKS